MNWTELDLRRLEDSIRCAEIQLALYQHRMSSTAQQALQSKIDNFQDLRRDIQRDLA